MTPKRARRQKKQLPEIVDRSFRVRKYRDAVSNKFGTQANWLMDDLSELILK